MTLRMWPTVILLPVLAACGGGGKCAGEHCGTIVFAATAEPVTLLPPLAEQAVERDIHDQLFLKLAGIGPRAETPWATTTSSGSSPTAGKLA